MKINKKIIRMKMNNKSKKKILKYIKYQQIKVQLKMKIQLVKSNNKEYKII